MKNDVVSLKNILRDETNPLLISNKLSYYITDALREHEITLYEAYLLNFEEIRFRRKSYKNLAWGGKARISTCLAILNQKLLAHIFGENSNAEKLKEWGLEAYKLNFEKRHHYILDRYTMFLNANTSPELLQELKEVRRQYDKLSFDDGPYHNEVFPYHFYSAEDIILGNRDETELRKGLDENIEELIIELAIKE